MSRDFWKWRPGGSKPQRPAGAPSQPPPLPPASAEYLSTVSSAQSGAKPQQFPWKLCRSSDGKMRVDHGDKSVISNPIERQAITLDHVKREALAIPTPQQETGPPPIMPTGDRNPAAPDPPNVKELGKILIQGHEAEGKLYTFQPPAGPQPPAAGTPGAKRLRPLRHGPVRNCGCHCSPRAAHRTEIRRTSAREWQRVSHRRRSFRFHKGTKSGSCLRCRNHGPTLVRPERNSQRRAMTFINTNKLPVIERLRESFHPIRYIP